MIHTTLNLLKEKDACQDGYQTLIDHLGLDFNKDEPIALTTILESNNLDDTLWVLDTAALEEEESKLLRFAFGTWCARQVLHLYENEYPNDNRVRNCIEVTERFAKGDATQEELNAARAAAWAASDAARDAQEKKLKEMLEEERIVKC